jgi:hypothetical protein
VAKDEDESLGERKKATDALREALMAQANEPDPPIPDRPFELSDQAHYDGALSPSEALERLGLSTNTAIVQLNRELEHGRIEAIANEAIWGGANQKRARFPLVPTWAWGLRDMTPQDDFWETGYLYAFFPTRRYSIDTSRNISFFGIKFWPNNFPPPKVTATEQSTTPATAERVISRGGRPAKPWWDDLWADIGAQLYNGGLKPSRLADIEKAMHEWVARRGDTVGETPIRKAAKLLWDAIQRED